MRLRSPNNVQQHPTAAVTGLDLAEGQDKDEKGRKQHTTLPVEGDTARQFKIVVALGCKCRVNVVNDRGGNGDWARL